MSAMFGLNVQTLYYYDSIKLFSPKFRDEKNGRRKYEFDQIYELATICYMRTLGYSIEEIMEQRATQHADTAIASLKRRSEELRRQWEELISIDEAIQRKISYIENAMDGIQTDEIVIRHYEKRRYILIGGEDAIYRQNSFYFFPTIAFYKDDKKYFGAYLNAVSGSKRSDAVPERFSGAQVEEIPEGDYLCTYHLGPYETVPKTIERLRSSHPELTLDDVTINFNVLDQFVEHDSKNYITQMQIRILR